MKGIAWLLLFLAVVSTFMSSQITVRAEEDVEADDNEEEDVDVTEEEEEASEYEEEEEYEEGMEAPDVVTRFFFPDHGDKRLPVGKEITILVDFTNNGDEPYNVSAVAAYLHSPFDLNYYIQNFTAKALSGFAGPGQQVSLEYTFTPDASLEPLEFWLSGIVEYNNSDDMIYRSTFINATVELIEENATPGVQTFVTYFMVLGGVGLVAYIGTTVASKAGISKKKRKKTVARVSESTAADWDVDVYKQSDQSRSARARKKGVKK